MRGAGQVHPLVGLEQAAGDHPTGDVQLPGGEHLQFQQSVVNEDAVAGFHVSGKLGVLDGHLADVAHDGPRGQDYLLSGNQKHPLTFHLSNPQLGPLQVGQDGYGFSHLGGDSTDALDVLAVVGLAAVGEIQASHVHASQYQFPQHFRSTASRPDGANDLGAQHPFNPADPCSYSVGRGTTSTAAGPLGVCSTRNSTFCPSCRVPWPSMLVW